MKIRLSFIVITLLLSLSVSLAETVTISTTNGTAGADAYVMGGTAGSNTNHLMNYGGATALIIKEGNTNYCRKSYARFDLSDMGSYGHATNVTLDLVVANNYVKHSTVAFYGLEDGDSGELWIEGTLNNSIATAGEITWDNAPANQTDSGNGVLGNAHKLGELIVNTNDVTGTMVSFSSDALTHFINTDTNGVATIIMVRRTSVNNSLQLQFASKEHATLAPPTLTIDMERDGQYVMARADSYIRGDTEADTNYGQLTYLTLKGSGSANWHRKVYLGFEVPDIESGMVVEEAELLIRLNSIQDAATTTPLKVWGLKDSVAGANWGENLIVWTNAPGMSGSSTSIALETDEVTLLGTIPVAGASNGDIFSFESDDLRTFIEGDSDGLATIIIESSQDKLINFTSREQRHTLVPPTLRLVVSPNGGTMILIQ